MSDQPSRGEPRRPDLPEAVNHYCTTFDARYAVQGVALGLSLKRHDPTAVLWMLCLDDATAKAIRALGETRWRVVTLDELEAADLELLMARENRSWVEYVFTLSPCWPRYLLRRQTEIEVVTYVDADVAFFAEPTELLAELGTKSVLVTEHRFPKWLRHLETRGRFNVGVECYRNDAAGRAVLDDWRARCLAWCHDRVEAGRYADQKYLDAWPQSFPGVVVSKNPGVNLAPWNWMNHRYRFDGDTLRVGGHELVVFHFARFRWWSERWADSGQLEYGVMPLRLRSWIYGRYADLLGKARARIATVAPELARPVSVARGTRVAWKTWLLDLAFGPVWWRLGPWWISGRLGLGRFSGRVLALVRGTNGGEAK